MSNVDLADQFTTMITTHREDIRQIQELLQYQIRY